MAAHKRIVNDSKINYCIIYDNASIHKTKLIQSISIESKITILTIPSYWPVLNAAEKLILGIKKKIFKYKTKEGTSVDHIIFLLYQDNI